MHLWKDSGGLVTALEQGVRMAACGRLLPDDIGVLVCRVAPERVEAAWNGLVIERWRPPSKRQRTAQGMRLHRLLALAPRVSRDRARGGNRTTPQDRVIGQ